MKVKIYSELSLRKKNNNIYIDRERQSKRRNNKKKPKYEKMYLSCEYI